MRVNPIEHTLCFTDCITKTIIKLMYWQDPNDEKDNLVVKILEIELQTDSRTVALISGEIDPFVRHYYTNICIDKLIEEGLAHEWEIEDVAEFERTFDFKNYRS